jgi:hypothetical protein
VAKRQAIGLAEGRIAVRVRFMCYKISDSGEGALVRKQPIILTDEITPPPALVRAGLDALPAIIRAQGERASRRFIEFFTANIRNRNTRAAYVRAIKQFFDWTDKRRLELHEIEAIRVAIEVGFGG